MGVGMAVPWLPPVSQGSSVGCELQRLQAEADSVCLQPSPHPCSTQTSYSNMETPSTC